MIANRSVCVCVCMCVCERERDRETERVNQKIASKNVRREGKREVLGKLQRNINGIWKGTKENIFESRNVGIDMKRIEKIAEKKSINGRKRKKKIWIKEWRGMTGKNKTKQKRF